jgi:Bacterial Ig-like domain (group 1)/Viral BACON domain
MKKAFGSHARVLSVLILVITAFATAVHAQSFASVPALSFTKTFGGANPLPQVLTAASTGAQFNADATASTTTGGSWLTISPASGVSATPAVWVVSVNPSVSLAAGTYTGQIVINEYPSDVPTMTVPVSLIITAAGKPFFDDMTGQVSFSMVTGGAPPAQAVQIRNGGTGTLNWTAGAATADGGAWLTLSATSGKAPATVSVGLVPANLPGGGATAGTWVGMIMFQATGCSVTVPVRVTVGPDGFTQVNPLNFTMPFAGLSPLPQVLNIASPGSTFNFYTELVATGNGGNWLSVSPATGVHGTPSAFTVSVANASALPAGIYTGEIVFFEYPSNTLAMTVPVTLTIAASTASFFDNLPGALSYFMTPGGALPGQTVQIRNGGTGTLKWTGSKSTGDGGNWLTLSAASGTAPSIVTVGITTKNLPGEGLVAGTYCGQVVFQATGDVGTVPVCVTVGSDVFWQVNPINFTMTEGGATPLPQVLTPASTGASFNFYDQVVATGTGGSWLSISPASGVLATPEATNVIVGASASTLPAGIYTGEIVYFAYPSNDLALVVPVTLTVVAPDSAAYFDNLPGGLSFFTSGGTPPAQTLQVRNAGTGTLSWTAATSTADGGPWLKVSPPSGTAPATVSVSIVPSSLPGDGLIAGTYCGQVLLQTTGDVGTVPVCAVVGPNVFGQVNPLSFTMPVGGGNPLPQEITIASTGTAFNFYNSAVSTATGGAWLKITPSSGVFGTPGSFTVSVSAATLPAGIYTGQIVFSEYPGNTMAVTVPVTLTVAPTASAYFDNLPGQLSFSLAPGGKPPAQLLQIRNAGTGTLKWTGSSSTADGGKWLTLSVASGTAPTAVSVSITPGNLPGEGLVAGNYCGQVSFVTAGDTATIPVCVVVGPNVFNQVNPLSFNMPFGGSNPLPQVIPVTSNGAAFNYYLASLSTSKGGNWLQLSSTTGVSGTPGAVTASVVNASTLPVGVYTGEVVFSAYPSNNMTLTVPVTLTVTSCGPFFDSLPGLMSFSFAASTTSPPSQTVQVRAAGSGALKWTLSTSTADGGAWLSVSSKSGTAPSTVTVKVVNSALPGSGLVAGNFNGQLLFQSSGGNFTVPVTVAVGPSVFSQAAPVNFSMNLGGANPATQNISVTSIGTAFNFYTVAVATGKGGTWLTVNPATGVHGTPTTITATVSGSTLLAGIYTGEIIFFEYPSNGLAMEVPVTLTVTDPHVPATIKATGGTPQSATVNKNFTNPLVATVQDASGNPVSGLLLTFSPPTTGASGTFACGNTAVTNSEGIATSQVFKANTVAGKYSVKATGAGLTSNPSFAMTNKAGPAASITASGGTPQTATVNTAFATNLAATVEDMYGNPVSGGTVTFTAPDSGASGTFAGGVTTAKTSAEGIATAPVFTANTTPGAYTVTAGIATFTTSPGFALTNVAGAPATVVTTAGTPQTATVNTAFATNLSVTVTDSFGNPVSGATVTFNAPASGASGTFAGGANTAVTNTAGLATAAVFKANTTAGTYTVTATAGGVTTSPGFALTNKAGAAATITASGGTPQTATVNTAFAKRLTATVNDSFGNPISGATVTFTAPASGASGTFAGGANTAKTSAQGVATAAVFTANGTAGSYTVTAKTGAVTTSPGYQLTNQAAASAGD